MLAKFAVSGGQGVAAPYSDDVFRAFSYTGSGAYKQVNIGLNLAAGDPDFDKVVFILDSANVMKNRITDTALSVVSGFGSATYQTTVTYAKFDVAATCLSSTTVDSATEWKYTLGLSQPNFNQPWCVEFYAASNSAAGTGAVEGSGVIYLDIGTAPNQLRIAWYSQVGNATLQVHVEASTGPTANISLSGPPAPSHYKVNYDGTNLRAYVNDTLVDTAAWAGWDVHPQVSLANTLHAWCGTGDTSGARGRMSIQALRMTFGSARIGQLAYTQQPPMSILDGGGLVWAKSRTTVLSHKLANSASGAGKILSTDLSGTQSASSTGITTLTNQGFTLGSGDGANNSSANFISWAFKKAARFFDVVFWNSTGSGAQTIPHSLKTVPGLVLTKSTSQATNWAVSVLTSSTTTATGLSTNLTDAALLPSQGNSHTSLSIMAGAMVDAGGNTPTVNGAGYVSYIFAHDPSPEGIIQCGTFTTNGVGNFSAGSLNLGWEPQFFMYKRVDGISPWYMYDAIRQFDRTSTESVQAESTQAENFAGNGIYPTATGIEALNGTLINSATYLFMAIRRPNKPPTTGTQIYNSVAYAASGSARTVVAGFAPDMALIRTTNVGYNLFMDRLRGKDLTMQTNNTAADVNSAGFGKFVVDGIEITTSYINNNLTNNFQDYFFKRAVGVFDVVHYKGDGVTNRQVLHSLGVVPELMLIKVRNTTGGWYMLHKEAVAGNWGISQLETNIAFTTPNPLFWGNGATFTPPTAANFTVSAQGGTQVNGGSNSYIAYLFASKAGVSKVGSYVGDGTSGKVIDCGFTTGARFVMIKRASNVDDWYVWDSVRGVIAGNDPHFSLNSQAVETITDDSIDPDPSGFIVNQLGATQINIGSETYIYLAIA